MEWEGDWQFAIEVILRPTNAGHRLTTDSFRTSKAREAIGSSFQLDNRRPVALSPFCESGMMDQTARVRIDTQIAPITLVLVGKIDFLPMKLVLESVVAQIESAGWGLAFSKLKGLPQPCLAILIISKHLAFAGREDFNLVQVEEEYLRFSRTKLVGSGKTRWPVGVIRMVSCNNQACLDEGVNADCEVF